MADWQMKQKDDEVPFWRGWWHSHHNMGLFWSTVDDDMFTTMLKKHGEDFKDTVGIVFVNGGDCLTRYDVNTPIGTVQFNKLKLKIEGTVPDIDKLMIKLRPRVEKNCYIYNPKIHKGKIFNNEFKL